MGQLAEEVTALAAAMVKQERMECAAAVCPYCSDGWPLDLETGEHHYPDSGHILLPEGRCTAIRIHRRG